MAEALPYFPAFDVADEAGAKGPRWKKYVSRFRNLMVAMNITSHRRQRALLLHYVGEDTNEIFDTLPSTEATDDENPLDKAIDALTLYFEDKKNIVFEEYQFRKAKQEDDESIMAYYTRLRNLAKTCEFADTDREIKAQVIQHCTSTKLRRRGLNDPNITLKDLLEYGRTLELTDTRIIDLEDKDNVSKHEVNKLKTRLDTRRHNIPKARENHRKPNNSANNHLGHRKPNGRKQNYGKQKPTCINCGGKYPHDGGMSQCPAQGKECYNCGKLNHFSKHCLSQPRQRNSTEAKSSNQTPTRRPGLCQLNDNEDSDEDVYTLSLNSVKSNYNKHPMIKVKINSTWTELLIDSGASINLLDGKDFSALQPTPKLQATTVRIFPYKSKEPLMLLGKFNARIETANGATTEATFYVTEGKAGSILSLHTSETLGLIQVARPLTTSTESKVDQLVKEYDDLFHGLGKLKGKQVKIHIDEAVKPVAQPHRRVPFHVRKQLEEQLAKDEEQGVIERVDGPTPWVSPVVIAPKREPGKIRVCVDMRQPNKAIQRERHLTPTIKEVIKALNGATIFSKLDLNQGYNQLELAPESRHITTFSTHLGLRRYTRLNFGVSSAAEIFQNVICETLAGIQGAINLSDDILVYGKTQTEHDQALEDTFQRLRDSGLTLNKNKCVYNQPRLEFFGYVFSANGISPDPKKIQDIVNLETPSNASEVRSFLGMANYCSRFIPNYSSITQPLRELTKQSAPWQWTERQEQALEQVKDALVRASSTAYFDPDKETEILADASPVGLGAILCQTNPDTKEKQVVAYASRSLSETEQRYSQTEREALAIVWSCEHYHLYIYGKPVTVYSDHKPLEHIYNNPGSRTSARLERWSLRLQPYQVTVKYQKGSDNPADYMSRHPTYHKPTSRQEKIAEEFIDYITETSTPKAINIEEITSATNQDLTLQAVMNAINTGNWFEHSKHRNINIETYKAMEKVKNELTLSATHRIILKGTRIVMPSTLQQRVVDLAHEGHQGIVKTKKLLREKVWFHRMNSMVENKVASCGPCKVTTQQTTREPLRMSSLPASPWKEVSVDFKQLSNHEYLLVITDDYSRYPVVEVVRSTAAATVIPQLDKAFATFGVPEVLRSDNGPPFNGKEFKEFANTLGFTHRKVMPLWPRANGEVERFMRTLKKSILAARMEGKPWKAELCKLLRNYRSTPHSSTNIAPATVMFNRQMRNKLPSISSSPSNRPNIKENDQRAKAKMKAYADNKVYVKPSSISVGDTVIVQRDPSEKKSLSPYKTEPYIVTDKKGSMITAKSRDRVTTRNSSFFKQIPEGVLKAPDMDNDTDDSWNAPVDKTDRSPRTGRDSTCARRYPTRTRRPPQHLKDYVTK